MNIIKQKKACAEILDKLSVLDQNVTLAGGAPRNWDMDILANDFDFYLRRVEDKQEDTYKRSRGLEKILGLEYGSVSLKTWSKYSGETRPNYESMPFLKTIYEFKYPFDGEMFDCDVMYITKETYPRDIINAMDASICQIYWLPDPTPFADEEYGEFIKTRSYETTQKTKIITYKPKITPEHPHAGKMLRYYPQFSHVFGEEIIPAKVD